MQPHALANAVKHFFQKWMILYTKLVRLSLSIKSLLELGMLDVGPLNKISR